MSLHPGILDYYTLICLLYTGALSYNIILNRVSSYLIMLNQDNRTRDKSAELFFDRGIFG